MRNGGFNIDLALAGNGTLAYTTGGTLGSRRAVWVSREGGASAGGSGVGPAGRHRIGPPVPRREGAGRGVCRARAGATSGSSSSPRAPSRGSPSGTPRACGPPGRPTAARSSTSTTAPAPASGRPMPTGRTGPASRACCHSSSKDDFGQVVASRDGRWLVLRTAPVGAGSTDIMGLQAGDTTLVPAGRLAGRELYPALSPDGRWLAYASNESGAFEIYVRPFPETAIGQVAGLHRGRRRADLGAHRPGAVLPQRQERDGVGRDPAGRHLLGREAADALLGIAILPPGSDPVVLA